MNRYRWIVPLGASAVLTWSGDLMAGAKLSPPPPLPVFGPTAVTGDPGDGRAYLRWNLQIEDPRVVGWRVQQLAPQKKDLTREVLTRPEYVVRDLPNGVAHTFAVVGILKGGKLTPPGNPVTITPRETGTAEAESVAHQKFTVGEFQEVALGPDASKVIFPDGQELVFDRLRPVDWKTRDGEHLLYPRHFGNGLDVGKFDRRGLPLIIPPEGLKRTTLSVDDQTWSTVPPGTTDNFSVRWTGTIQPRFTEKYTFSTLTDDGVRLWVNGQLVIDRWMNQPPTEHTATVELQANQKYALQMEYFEGGGGASARLFWSSPSQSREVIPTNCLFPPGSTATEGTGLEGTYFASRDLQQPKLTRIDPRIDFDWGGGGPFDASPVEFFYQDLQFGTSHPHLTDPLTQPLSGGTGNDNRARWFPPQIDGDRVTFHYWQPLTIDGYRSWIFVLVWETWWPIERDRHGSTWHGLARQVEVMMPSSWKLGYQVMLNNGFGPNGSRRGVVSYSSGFREPGAEIVDFSGDKNRMVYFQSPRLPRAGYGFHPDHNCLQSSPLIFYDWGKGSLTVAARSEYYHCANASASYIEQGVDGVWPNLAWDMALAGERTWVDTVEYLYTAEVAQPLPQRYLNARFEAYADVSRRMGVQDEIAVTVSDGTHWDAQNSGGIRPYTEKYLAKFKGTGLTGFFNYHEFWHAVPITVDDAYRLDENHDCNPELKWMCDQFNAAGIRFGFWFRPEFTKTAVATALSTTIPTANTYYGYDGCHYPEVTDLLRERGIPLFRENTGWVRRQSDGSWPTATPYQWTPMSLATGWWDRIMWPTLWMSKKLGFDWVLMDGGFGGLQGVDYAPMLNGATDAAVPAQPYWWRMFRTMKHLDVRTFGECTVGWKGANVDLAFRPGDEHFLWMYHLGCVYNGEETSKPDRLHQIYQLYNGAHFVADAAPVHRYAAKYYREHRAPDWVELKDLRQLEPVPINPRIMDSPVAGSGGTRVASEDLAPGMVRPWTWDDVIWHYDDGTSVVYPAYGRIDWSRE